MSGRKRLIGINNRLAILAQALNDFAAEGGEYEIERFPIINEVRIRLCGVMIDDMEDGRYLVVAGDD